MRIDLTGVVQAVIALLAALVTYKLIPWIRSKTTEQQFTNLEAAARVAVFAAEQIFKNGNNVDKLDQSDQRSPYIQQKRYLQNRDQFYQTGGKENKISNSIQNRTEITDRVRFPRNKAVDHIGDSGSYIQSVKDR